MSVENINNRFIIVTNSRLPIPNPQTRTYANSTQHAITPFRVYILIKAVNNSICHNRIYLHGVVSVTITTINNFY